jgi:hypothetical protein
MYFNKHTDPTAKARLETDKCHLQDVRVDEMQTNRNLTSLRRAKVPQSVDSSWISLLNTNPSEI